MVVLRNRRRGAGLFFVAGTRPFHVRRHRRSRRSRTRSSSPGVARGSWSVPRVRPPHSTDARATSRARPPSSRGGGRSDHRGRARHRPPRSAHHQTTGRTHLVDDAGSRIDLIDARYADDATVRTLKPSSVHASIDGLEVRYRARSATWDPVAGRITMNGVEASYSRAEGVVVQAERLEVDDLWQRARFANASWNGRSAGDSLDPPPRPHGGGIFDGGVEPRRTSSHAERHRQPISRGPKDGAQPSTAEPGAPAVSTRRRPTPPGPERRHVRRAVIELDDELHEGHW